MLSRFISLSKCQFELVNPELFTDKYGDTDIVFYESILSVSFSEPRTFVRLRIPKK